MNVQAADAAQRDHWIVRTVLFPGEWVCDRFNLPDDDSRMLLRLYLNLVIYGKVFGTVAYVMT